jgi:DnaJ-class molecular chaperone
MTQLKRPEYPVGMTVETEINTFNVGSKNCPACDGRGKILLADSEHYKCPNCKGQGSKSVSTPCKKIIQMTVRTITMIINRHGQQISYECVHEGRLSIYGENELRKAV